MTCLTESEVSVLGAILDRLIPGDEHGPGAVEAGVLMYVDRALAGPLAGLRPAYASNLLAADAYAVEVSGGPFVSLDPVRQDAVLRALEDGSAPGFDPSSAEFFALLRQHAVEGMFADPAHGGNVGFAGWRLIGFPGPKGTFGDADQQLDAEVRPVWADGD